MDCAGPQGSQWQANNGHILAQCGTRMVASILRTQALYTQYFLVFYISDAQCLFAAVFIWCEMGVILTIKFTLCLVQMMACIGEQFTEGDEICGIVVNVRARQDRLCMWTKTASNEAAQVGCLPAD